MQYTERWEEIEDIGEGGQGKVIRVFDRQKVQLDLSILTEAIAGIDRATRFFPFGFTIKRNLILIYVKYDIYSFYESF